MNITILYNKANTDDLPIDKRASEEDTEQAAMLAQNILKGVFDTITLFSVTPQKVHTISTIKADCIVNFIEYTSIELQYAANVFIELRKLGIPYTGCTFDTYYLTTNKVAMKTAFDAYHIQSPKWQFFETIPSGITQPILYPQIVKLAYEHCGVGLTDSAIVHSDKELLSQITHLITSYQQPAIAEDYIDGRELQVTLLQTAKNVAVLPIAEYKFPEKQKIKILTYDSRWLGNTTQDTAYECCIAKLPDEVINTISKMCIHAYTSLGFRGYARFDLRLRGDIPYIIETNSNPGLDDALDNGLVLSYKKAGMSYADFLSHIITQAIANPMF